MDKLSISFSSEVIKFAQEWHGGQSSMLYAISSTGALTLGSIRPRGITEDVDHMHVLCDRLESELPAGADLSSCEDNAMMEIVEAIAEFRHNNPL